LAGCVSIGAQAFVATGASVIPEICIGEGSVIGAGSVVVRDVPAHVVAYGCPARCRRVLQPTAIPPRASDGPPGTTTSTPPLRLVS
jgi:acetyltransferase-like isoleucine patch superfamily enzyme